MALTDKQARFVEEYLIDLNATQAAIRAGYAASRAQQTGSDLLSNRKIQDALQRAMQARSERTAIDADYVLKRLVEFDQMDVGDICDDEGYVLPIKQWPSVWRRSISAIEVSQIFESADGQKVHVGDLKKIKWPEKSKIVELIGKHVQVQAFREQVKADHSGEVNHNHRDMSDDELDRRINELSAKG